MYRMRRICVMFRLLFLLDVNAGAIVECVENYGENWEEISDALGVSEDSCQTQYEKAKKMAKKILINDKKHVMGTGGGPSKPRDDDPILDKLCRMVGPTMDGMYTIYDGDSALMALQNKEPLEANVEVIMVSGNDIEEEDNAMFTDTLTETQSEVAPVPSTSKEKQLDPFTNNRANLKRPKNPKLHGGVWSLKNLSISVPRAVLSGEGQAAVLRCSYDLEGAALYSIRWYRGETEFYRYVPRELPPSMVFPLPGASVDLTQSDHQQVRIVNLNRRLSGDYQCEVSADAPLFHTDIRWAPLTVVDPPFRAPRLTVSRDNFARGDVIRANCSVDEAYPAPNITWLLDDHKIAETIPDPPPDLDFSERGASSHLEISVLETEQYKVGLTYTSSSLGRVYREYGYEQEPRKNVTTVRYTMVSPPSGQFTLRCVTMIFDIYSRKSESVVIREDTPRPESVTGEDSSGALSFLSLLAVGCAGALHAL